jgi:FkbM family methyltransferase
MGALDGDRFSNTHAFYSSPDLGWKGVNVEVDPESYARLVINRKNDIANVHAAVCDDTRTIHFAMGTSKAVGGIWEFATEDYREKWWPGVTLERTVPVQCAPLNVILDQALGTGHHYFDFWSLDVEGAELSVLRGTDFEKLGFGIIIVESHGDTPLADMDDEIIEFLNERGYDLITDRDTHCTADNMLENRGFKRDNWFINRDFKKIYAGYTTDQRRNKLRG